MWNHLPSHEGQEAVVLEGAVVPIDAAVLGEAAVPEGGEFLLYLFSFYNDGEEVNHIEFELAFFT